MATRDSIVQVPFIGGIDEGADPDQLQAPAMKSLVNVTTRKPGRIEKRAGFEFIAQTGSTTVPATVFGGVLAALPSDVEAVGANNGADGTKTLVAAGSKLFEYVGTDASHGFREVNRLPPYVGTLHPVSPMGGDVIEVESMLNNAGTLRCTVWVAGTSNGHDMASDTAISSQPANLGGVFYAVQRVLDGAYVVPPTRVTAPSLFTALTQCCDLRMCLVNTVGASARSWIVAFRTQYSTLLAFVVDGVNGDAYQAVSLGVLSQQFFHRSFDITGIPGQDALLVAVCQNEGPGNVDVHVTTWNVGPVGAIVMSGGPLGLLAAVLAVNIYAGAYTWNRFVARGVVLEAEPVNAGAISIAVRAIYSAAGPVLDGKMVVTRIDVTSGLAVVAGDYAVLHRIGFQTDDNIATSYANVGSTFTTGTFDMLLPALSALHSTVFTASDVIIITAELYDGTKQTYAAGRIGTSSWSAIAPYAATELALISASNLYPKPYHSYPGTSKRIPIYLPTAAAAAVLPGSGKISKQQVTRIIFDPTKGIGATAIAGKTVVGELWTATTLYCRVVMSFAAGTGFTLEAAIYDGTPGDPSATTPTLIPMSQIVVTAPAAFVGAYAFVGGGFPVQLVCELNSANPHPVKILGYDVASQTSPAPQNYFDSKYGPEMCVHRWDVKRFYSGRAALAISSVSAVVYSTPSGDAPLHAASPFAENNFFEVYEWSGAPGEHLNVYAGGTSQSLITALGGPWRMLSGLAVKDDRLFCVISPAGDAGQKSAFLVSLARPASLVVVSTPKPAGAGGGSGGSGGYTYSGNIGVFVESINMPRIAGVPINCPRLVNNLATGIISCGVLRMGAGLGGTDVFALDYRGGASSWRGHLAWGDYTVFSGGVVSLFDGVSCQEATPLLWPQSDFVSIAYDREPTKLYSSEKSATGAYATTTTPHAFSYGDLNAFGPLLSGITRPFFAYEAGLNSSHGTFPGIGMAKADMGWSFMSTSWGGAPTADYASVYADPRLQLFALTPQYGVSMGVSVSGSGHYYGRYQSGSAADAPTYGGLVYLAVWAPRQAGESPPAPYSPSAAYTPIVANGDFLARWVYESIDGTGRTVRSAPSKAVTFTICAAVQYTKNPALGGQPEAVVPGGVVDEYRYGFFAPRAELTNGLKTAEANVSPTIIQPYFTAEPFATVFYRVPPTNFCDGFSGVFTVGSNVTRGVVPYSSSSNGVNPYGIVTNNFRCFDGSQGDYNGILAQPYLYTTGGVLDNVCPPAALCMCIHQNRLVLGGADNTTVVWFSKELSPTDAPGFNDALTIQIEEGGAVTGLASFNGLLFVFKRRAAFVVAGDMPDDTGGGIGRGNGSISSLATPVRMAHDIGCINHRSVVETPIGIFFQSERTLELLDQNMAITPVGFALEETLAAFPEVTNAIHHPKDGEVWFTVHTVGAVGAAGEQFRVLVFNYLTKQWSTSKFGAIGTGRVQLGIVDNRPCLAAAGAASGVVYRQTPSKFFDVAPTGRQYVAMSGTTAPVALNQIQGYERVKRLRVFGNPVPSLSTGAAQTREPHGFSMMLQSDFKNTGVFSAAQTATWTQSESLAVWTDQSREVYEVHLANQKCQQVVLSFAETAPSDITTLTHGYGTSLSNMALVVGLKSGLDKGVTPGAKH